MWLPPHLRRLLAKHQPYKILPRSRTWEALLTQKPEPWNPKKPARIKVDLPPPPKKKRMTPKRIRTLAASRERWRLWWAAKSPEEKKAYTRAKYLLKRQRSTTSSPSPES